MMLSESVEVSDKENNSNATLLFVDDEKNILSSLRRMMRKSPYNCLFAESGADALSLLEQQPIDVVISDMKMPEMTGEQLLAQVAEKYPETIRIVLTGFSNESMIMGAINEGRIWGFIHKPWNNTELRQVLEHAVDMQQAIAERGLLKQKVEQYEQHNRDKFQSFLGSSIPMQLVYSSLEKSAPSNASVMITGESGTGKELAARAIHDLSGRSTKSLVAINCAAIPHDLMESEIFGHIKGAFSGAFSNRQGAASLADGGTLFLDELAEMDISLQSKLLRFIQTGTFSRVGSNVVEHVDIRFLCATNQEPLKAIENQKLREDLYYRLNVISINLPPLRDREQDSLTLAHHFLASFAESEAKVVVGFSKAAEKLIEAYTWPGNVRQLENAVQSMVIMSEGPLITPNDLANSLSLAIKDIAPDTNDRMPRIVPAALESIEDSQFEVSTSVQPLADVEQQAIRHALDFSEGNVVRAAGLLKVSPSTLYRKMQNW